MCLGRRRRPRHHSGGGPPPPAHPGAGAGPESGRAAQAGRGGGVHRSRRHRRHPRPCRRLHPPGRGAPAGGRRCPWWPPGGGPPLAASLPGTSCRSWSGGSSGWTDSSAPPSPPSMPSGTPSAGPCWPTRRRRRGALWPTSCWAAPPPRSGPHPRLRLHQPRAGPGGTHRRRGQGPGHPPVPPASVCWGATPVPSSRGGKRGFVKLVFHRESRALLGGSVVLLPGHRSHLRARPGGHAGADGGAAAPPGAPPIPPLPRPFPRPWRRLFPSPSPFFSTKRRPLPAGASFFPHSLPQIRPFSPFSPFFALSLTEVLSAGDITALPCRNLR